LNYKIDKIKKNFGIEDKYVGWGRKKSGQKAIKLAKKHQSSFLLLEDGFIRSIGLGIDKWESFSIVEDDLGIYYDATMPSRLENILNSYRFNEEELHLAQQSIALIKKYKISKYNNSTLTLPKYLDHTSKKVLIIAQTKGDMSLKYGLAEQFDTKEMIKDAIGDNPDCEVYIKIHPDVLTGKKESNIDIEYAKKYCKIIIENINPIVLLEKFDKVYTQTSQMGFEALLLDKEVYLYGMPFYAGWGLTRDKLAIDRREKRLNILEIFAGAYILYTKYYNPYTNQSSNIIDTIETIVKYRDLYSLNDGDLYLFGFTFWKKQHTKKFFKPLNNNKIYFCKDLSDAMVKGLNADAKIYIWGKKEYPLIRKFATDNSMDIYTVEDGFIRSVALGSDLTKAYSLVVDKKGIYFDPNQESDLEYILNNYTFDKKILQRAKKLKHYVIDKGVSKYNVCQDKELVFDTDKKIILVVGQVEDDASIIYGGAGMSNLELLEQVYLSRKDEYIIYKPHPDVEAGNRKGKINKDIVLQYANVLVADVSIVSLIDKCDELHTITSLSGFEAMIRNKVVYTYGMPFYAGWGLSIDMKQCKRRNRKLSIDELVAATYIIYPRYISPVSNDFCEVEALVVNLEIMKKRYNNRLYKMAIDIRNLIVRISQSIIRSLF